MHWKYFIVSQGLKVKIFSTFILELKIFLHLDLKSFGKALLQDTIPSIALKVLSWFIGEDARTTSPYTIEAIPILIIFLK